MQDLYEMGKNFYELPGWEVSIRCWRCKCLEDETFFHANTSEALPLQKNKAIFRKPQRFFLKALNSNGRYEISKRDRQDRKIPVVEKGSGHWVLWTHEVNSTENPFKSWGLIEESSASDLGSYEVHVIFPYILLLNSDSVYFALF